MLGLINFLTDNYGEKNIDFLWHLTFILQMINSLMILNNFNKISGVNENLLLKINFLLIFTYLIIILTANNFYLSPVFNLNFYNFSVETNSNGISRMLFIINIFITCSYFFKKKNIILFKYNYLNLLKL